MKEIEKFNEIEATEGGGFKRLPADGYVCRITLAKDVPEKEYLKVEYDIAEGEYKDWWSETMERAGFWGGKLIRSYKQTAQRFFKGFTSSVEQSNSEYIWKWDENSLIGKLVGLVLAEEEYTKNDGTVGTRLYVARNTNIENIRSGKYEVPPLKKLNGEIAAAPTIKFDEVLDEELPF